MADLISIFFPAKSKGKIDSITFDLVSDETHSFPNDITNYPVESGETISDNITLKPVQLSMSGIITDTPFLTFTDPKDLYHEIFDEGRSQAIFKQLIELRQKEKVFDVVTGLNVYQNMFFTSLNINRNGDTGKSFRISAGLQQVNFADAKTIIIPPDKIANKPDDEQKDRGNSDDDKGINDKTDQGDIKNFINNFFNKSLLEQMLEKTGANI